MALTRKCPKCGLDLLDPALRTCPMCGAVMVATWSARVWLLALFQVAFSSIFMLVFRFPKILIAIFGVIILLVIGLSARLKSRPAPAARAPQRPVSHPALFKILTLAVGLCYIACFCFLLFGFVAFINSWTDWERYKGEPYHQADFLVTQVYYQRLGKGGIDVYARGTVEGQREWMTLPSLLYAPARNQSEVAGRVPAGTSISIYLFPGMKGRLRARPYQQVPIAEAYHRDAMNALQYGLGGLAICGGILLVLIRLRAACFAKNENAFAASV